MEKILVNSDSIKAFGNKIIVADIIRDMYKDSVLYNDMVDNKAGNLYKEVMLRELKKEEEKIINNNEVINNIFSDISERYNDTISTISNSVSG